MATALHIHVVEAPITDKHLLAVLADFPEVGTPALWKAIGVAVDEKRPITDAERAAAEAEDAPLVAIIAETRERVASDMDLVHAAVAAYEVETGSDALRAPFPDGETWDSFVLRQCRNPFMQMALLAPNLYIGESGFVEDDHGINDLQNRPFTIDAETTEIILDAVRNATAPDANVPDAVTVAAFLERHSGKRATIIGH